MVIFIVIYCGIYLHGIFKGKIKPILSTWLLLLFATILSFLTDYKETGRDGLFSNAFNMIDGFATLSIFLVVLFYKDTRKKFSLFEKRCLFATFLIFIFWIISGENILSHLAVQVILVIAYFPTIIHLWHAKKNTESLSMWTINCVAAAFGTIEPIRSMSLLPLVYGLRAVVCTLTVALLVFRLKLKTKKVV